VLYLEKLNKRGGMTGRTAANTFEGHKFDHEEDLLIRETTQNSKDNTNRKGLKPRIVIRLKKLSGKAKKRFVEKFNLLELYRNGELKTRLEKDSELHSLADKSSLGVLVIEDFNTRGLNGAIDDPKGNWMRFNLLGDAAKLEEQLKIGSYGFGKTVLTRSSGTGTFLVYTRIDPSTQSPEHSRFMGHTFQPLFVDKNREQKSGRGWICKRVDEDLDPIPFIDKEADELARVAGFSERAQNETGASFMLIGTNPAGRKTTIDSIRRAFETWWWPSLEADELDVELYENDVRVPGPSPKLRKDLRPYLDCKAKLDGGLGDAVHVANFNKFGGHSLGRLAMTVVPDETIFGTTESDKVPGSRRVARMNAQSGMITEYRRFGVDSRVPFVGFFLGHEDVFEYLRRSEPAAHDEWSASSQRLSKLVKGKEIVKHIEERTNSHCLTFQRNNSNVRSPSGDRLPELEKLIGAAFESGKGSKTQNPSDIDRVTRLTEYDFPQQPGNQPRPIFGDKSNRLDFLIRYRLRKSVSAPTKVKIRLNVYVAQDVDLSQGDSLSMRVIDQKSARQVVQGPNPEFDFSLKPGETRVFRVESDSYPKHQVLLFRETELAL